MHREKLPQTILFILFVLLCSYPLFINLGNVSARMWDESRNGVNALEMFYDHNFIVTHFNGKPDLWNTKPPFFIWMVVISMKLFGASVFSLRFPSALSALAITIYSFWFSKKYLNTILPGFFAGLVLVTSVGFIDYHVARNGDFDAMLSMWIFFYCTQFFIYLESKQRKHLIFASLFLAFAILTKGIAGCLFLPGIFLFLILNKKYHSVFKKRELYVLTLLGFLVGASYYFVREVVNPGYIKAVIENEITGRYLRTAEGHEGDFWFYLRFLNNVHFSVWLCWLPLTALITYFTCERISKNFSIFLGVQIICYLFILSLSKTKLNWYEAPLFPFMALLIGLGLSQIYDGLKKIISIKSKIVQTGLFICFCSALFSTPVQGIFHTSIVNEKEHENKNLFFGDFLANFYFLFPQQQSLKIIYQRYNAHLSFYTKIYQHNGRTINVVKQNSEISNRDTIMICDTSLWPRFNPAYVFDTLYQEGDFKFILTLTTSNNLSDPLKIGEKNFFRYMGGVENNPEWLSAMKEKAKNNNIELKKQMMEDAVWQLKQGTVISSETEEYLKKKYNL